MYEQQLPIEEWKAKKQAELKETIAAQKSVLQEVVQDGQRLADYLYGRGRLGSHITSGNAALVLQTLPQARAVLTAKDWDKFGRRVNKGAKGIPQLVRVNGYYNVGSIFDVSMPDEIRRMRDDECLLLMRSEDPVIDKKYNLLHHPNVKYTPDAGGEPYVMPPDYMGDAVTITMDAVAAATAPEITEEMYEQLDYLEKHPEENYYENEENFSQYDQGD